MGLALSAQTETPNYSGVYSIRCIETGKVYVGSAKWIAKRWRNHREELRGNKHCNSYLQRAWNKYGEKSFNFIVLEQTTDEDLICREQFYIDSMNAANRDYGYNARPIADSNRGVKFSPEACKRISEACKGRIISDEARMKISEKLKGNTHMLGKKASEATLEKLRNARVGKKPSLGMKHSEKSKKAIGERFKGINLDPEHKEKIRQAHLGKKQSKQHRANLAMAQKKLSEDQIIEIMALLKSGNSMARIGLMFGVCAQTICNIKHGKVEVYKWAS